MYMSLLESINGALAKPNFQAKASALYISLLNSKPDTIKACLEAISLRSFEDIMAIRKAISRLPNQTKSPSLAEFFLPSDPRKELREVLLKKYMFLITGEVEDNLQRNLDKSIECTSRAYASCFNATLRNRLRLNEHSKNLALLTKVEELTPEQLGDIAEPYLRKSHEEVVDDEREMCNTLEEYEIMRPSVVAAIGVDVDFKVF
jgi:hypothetical protein